jgi:hypothetical protein
MEEIWNAEREVAAAARAARTAANLPPAIAAVPAVGGSAGGVEHKAEAEAVGAPEEAPTVAATPAVPVAAANAAAAAPSPAAAAAAAPAAPAVAAPVETPEGDNWESLFKEHAVFRWALLYVSVRQLQVRSRADRIFSCSC